MGRFNKKYIMIILLIGIFLLTGCNKLRFSTFNASDEENNNITVTSAPQEETGASETEKIEAEATTVPEDGTPASESATPTPGAIQPTANIELPIYTVNVDTGDIETITALISKDIKITPELIVNTVVEAMADASIEVGIESVTTKDDAVIVSFYKDKAPLSEMGSGYEAAILDAIAQSIIDNLADYSEVIYRAEGKAYSSGHIELEINEVYLGR